MAIPSLPSSVNAAKWKTLTKGEDPGGLLAVIDKLAKAALSVDAKALEVPKFTDVAEATKFRERAAAQLKAADAVADLVKDLQKKGDKVYADVKKDKAKAEVAKFLAALLADAPGFAAELRAACADAETKAADAITAIEDAQKKAEAAAEKDDPESEAMANEKDDKKFFENLKSKYKAFFNQLRNVGAKLKPAEAAATKAACVKFRMVSQGKVFGVGISKNSFGEGELKIARRMAELKSGGKDSKGIIYWNSEDKVFVFEGGNVPSGAANATALKVALKARLGYAPKVRIQKPGEKGEDSDGPAEEDPDFKADEVAAGGGAATGGTAGGGAAAPEAAQKAAQDLLAKLEPLKGKLDQRIKAGGADAEKLKILEKGVRDEASRSPAKAKQAYDALVALLGAAPAADSAVPLPNFQKSVKDWLDVRKRYSSEVKALADALPSIYREELATRDPQVVKAIGEAKAKLTKTAELIGPEVEKALAGVMTAAQRAAQRSAAVKAKAEVDALARKLMGDPVFVSLDGKNNELKPDMTVVADVTRTLKSVSDAMAEALKA